MTRYITQSELSTYRECKRKWWLGWFRKIKLDPSLYTPNAASLGQAVHSALESLYKGEDWLAVLAALQNPNPGKNWDNHPLGPPDMSPEQVQFEKQIELARIMIEGYIEWLEESGADSNIEVLAQEEQIEVPLSDLPVTLMGKLDQRIRIIEPEGFGFLDFKTVQNFTDIPKMAELNDQFKHYSLLMKLKDPDSPFRGGIWRMLRKVKRTATAKPPFYSEYAKLYNDHQIASYEIQMRGLIASILRDESQLNGGKEHLEVVPPTPHRDCTWKCEFFQICPMFDDGSRVEDFISEYYVTIDPLEGRYNTSE